MELDGLRWNQIAAARDAGASWATIGEALGVSRQSAWEYFTRRVGEDEALELAVEESLGGTAPSQSLIDADEDRPTVGSAVPGDDPANRQSGR